MRRRDLIAYGSAAALTTGFLKSQIDQRAEAAINADFTFELHIEEIYEELIDGEVVFSLAYRDPLTRLIRPPLYVTEGAMVKVKLVNKTRRTRRFALTGLPDDRFPVLAAGQSRNIAFTAPASGSYIYHDTAEGAAGRLVGLHGALIIMPVDGRTAAGSDTPYTAPTASQSMLFDALGTSSHFPGEKWLPNDLDRMRIWMMSEVDPRLNQTYERNLPVESSTLALSYAFNARYFTLNGLSGFDSSHDDSCCPAGYEGEPRLLRTMNAGLCTHAPHIHGNHVYQLSDTNSAGRVVKCKNVVEVDTWMLRPMHRRDMLLPFVKPDEIPAEAWPPREEPFPLLYPMHCHIEMSQTAAGGNYPQGLVTHWEMLGPRRGA